MRKAWAGTGLLAAAVFAVGGCASATSSVHVTASESAAAQAARQRGIVVLEGCVPNGKAMIGPVFDHTATLLTYHQVYKYFKVPANQQAVWACASKKATASIPGTDPKATLAKCFSETGAAKTAAEHPLHSAHHPVATIESLLNAAAICAGKYV